MVLNFGLTSDEADTGYYAGFIGGAFFVGAFISSFFWGLSTDRWGRKKNLLVSMALVGLTSLAFALSPRYMASHSTPSAIPLR